MINKFLEENIMYKIILISFFSSLLFVSCSGSLDEETKLIVDALKADKSYSDWSEDDAICFAKDMKKSLPDNIWDTFLILVIEGEQADVDFEVAMQIVPFMYASAGECKLTLKQ